jgi:hypothetical protein
MNEHILKKIQAKVILQKHACSEDVLRIKKEIHDLQKLILDNERTLRKTQAKDQEKFEYWNKLGGAYLLFDTMEGVYESIATGLHSRFFPPPPLTLPPVGLPIPTLTLPLAPDSSPSLPALSLTSDSSLPLSDLSLTSLDSSSLLSDLSMTTLDSSSLLSDLSLTPRDNFLSEPQLSMPVPAENLSLPPSSAGRQLLKYELIDQKEEVPSERSVLAFMTFINKKNKPKKEKHSVKASKPSEHLVIDDNLKVSKCQAAVNHKKHKKPDFFGSIVSGKASLELSEVSLLPNKRAKKTEVSSFSKFKSVR